MSLATNCSVAPRGTTDFPVPATLGNGLVYDATYTLVGRPRHDPEAPNAYAAEHRIAQLREKGFRPVQIDVKPYYDESQSIIRFDLPEFTFALVSDEDANHLMEVKVDLTWDDFNDENTDFAVAGGWRLVGLAPYMFNLDASLDSQRYSAIWVRDGWSSSDWQMSANLTENQLLYTLTAQASHGFRPISLEASTRWNSSESEFDRQFAVILARDEIGSQGTWDFSLELEDVNDLANDVANKASQGLVPFYISTALAITPSGSIELTEARFNVLYAEHPPRVGRLSPLDAVLEPDLDHSDLASKDQEMRAQGYHLVSVARYRDPNDMKILFVGIWHRYGRWLWVETVEGDATPAGEDFAPLEDAIRNLMEAENIPAAQLAVIQGNDLVLSRAYTRAPVAYAPITTATPLMAGSITKPVTAVAAVKAFGLQQGQGQGPGQMGIEGDLMELVPEPTIIDGTKPTTGITVRQALQHTSDWAIDASAHDVKVEIGEDRMPTSMDWLNYMSVQQNPNHGIDDSNDGVFLYSNFGYEMVALALKQHAQINPHDFDNEYESSLMKDEIFDEVGMCRSAYKRQGLLDVEIPWMAEEFREPEYGPCTAGMPCPTEPRYYLTEAEHPYAGATPPYAQLDNPAMFAASALDDDAPVPAFVRRSSYGGGDAIHAYIGAGALVTTAEDLARFMGSFRPFLADRDAQLDTILLTAAELDAMFPAAYTFWGHDPRPFNCNVAGRVETFGSGTLQACYGLGWYVGNGPGQESSEVWGHGGDVDGVVTMLMYHPETDATVAVLFARHPFSSDFLANQTLDPELDSIAQ